MQQINKIFDNNGKKVKIIAGDLTQGEWEFEGGTLWGPFEQIEVAGKIAKVTQQTEESVKALSETLGWGLAGALVFGPLGALAGVVLGGNRKEICALVELKDNRKFLAVMDPKVYQKFLACSMER